MSNAKTASGQIVEDCEYYYSAQHEPKPSEKLPGTAIQKESLCGRCLTGAVVSSRLTALPCPGPDGHRSQDECARSRAAFHRDASVGNASSACRRMPRQQASAASACDQATIYAGRASARHRTRCACGPSRIPASPHPSSRLPRTCLGRRLGRVLARRFRFSLPTFLLNTPAHGIDQVYKTTPTHVLKRDR